MLDLFYKGPKYINFTCKYENQIGPFFSIFGPFKKMDFF